MKGNRFAPVGIILLLALAACGDDASPTGPTGGDSPPEQTLKVLLHGSVESAYYEPFRDTTEEETYDGSQNVSDYDMLIFDGDVHTPQDVARDALIRRAFRMGKVVLGVDLDEAHKKDGLYKLVNASSCGDSPAYGMRMTQDANGRPVVQVFESGSGKTTISDEAPPITPIDPRACDEDLEAVSTGTSDTVAASAFADAFLDFTKETLQTLQVSPPANIPADLIYVTYKFTNFVPWSVTLTGEAPTVTQTASHQENYTFTVFLNNKNDPQGDFQFVLVDADMTTNPTNGTGNFAAARYKSTNNWVGPAYSEWAWFTDNVNMFVQPDDTSWTTVATSPETANNENSLTTGVSFSIGFSGKDPGGSFTYSNEVTRDITDWKVTNESSGLDTWWIYRTAYPFDADISYNTCGQAANDGCYWKLDPNDLSQNNMQLHTQSVFSTPSVINGNTTVNVKGYHRMVDVFCYEEGGITCYDNRNYFSDNTSQKDYTINLGAVVPIPIESITFDPSPVPAGTTATGTITLSEPAAMDTPISLSSNSGNATVLPTVIVKQGKTSATFQIDTSANGIPSGGQSVATITAFYADDFQAQLTVTN